MSVSALRLAAAAVALLGVAALEPPTAVAAAAPPPPFHPKPPPYPVLPTDTAGKRAAAKRASDAADAAAPAARCAVLSLLGDPAMKTFLHDMRGVVDGGEPLSNLSAVDLLTRVEAELSAAELVHNFGFQYPRSCGVDVTIENVPHFPDFYNQWTIQTLGVVPVDAGNNRFMEKAETNLFGFAPFKDVGAPDLPTATDRPIYGALNFYRDSAANLQCGPVAAVLSKTYIGDNAVAFPVDTVRKCPFALISS
jgi:hypothetical protein